MAARIRYCECRAMIRTQNQVHTIEGALNIVPCVQEHKVVTDSSGGMLERMGEGALVCKKAGSKENMIVGLRDSKTAGPKGRGAQGLEEKHTVPGEAKLSMPHKLNPVL